MAFRRPLRFYVVSLRGELSVHQSFREMRSGDLAEDGSTVVSGPHLSRNEAVRLVPA